MEEHHYALQDLHFLVKLLLQIIEERILSKASEDKSGEILIRRGFGFKEFVSAFCLLISEHLSII